MRFQSLLLILLSSAAALPVAQAAPSHIVLIRHAEKPADDDATGLSSRGEKRAEALVDFFLHDPRISRFGPPAAIYAFKQHRDDTSERGVLTMTPLARQLGIKIRDNYLKDEYQEAAEEILDDTSTRGKLVVICWERDDLNDFAEALGVQDAPKWGKDVFDRAWVLNLSAGKVTLFRDIPQRLLSGDDQD